MKKVMLMAIIAMGILVGSANAANNNWFPKDPKFMNVKLGGVIDGTMMFGTDVMTQEETGKHISIGLGMEYTGYSGPQIANQTFGSAYNLDLELKVGVNLQEAIHLPFPLKAKLGAGYGVTRAGDQNFWDPVGTVAVETNLYKKIGFGVEYKNAGNISSTSIFMTYRPD